LISGSSSIPLLTELHKNFNQQFAARRAICYTWCMIKSWQHKGLKRFHESGNKSGIIPEHERRLKVILQLLDAANHPEKLNLPGMSFHSLKGDLAEFFSVAVRANWKIIFKFEDKDAVLVDYLDYH